jgi:DNA-binding NarL/FixJ family response regulator
MSLKILLADDHMIVRRGLSILLNNEQDMEVVAQAENGQAAVELAAKLSPDIVVMDIAMPDLNGIEAARRILARNPAIHIIALSVHSEKQFVVEMFRAGASGYILKDCAFEELTQAIHAVTKRL